MTAAFRFPNIALPLVCCAAILCNGCGGDESDNTGTTTGNSGKASSDAESGAGKQKAKSGAKAEEATTISGIPKDVWPDVWLDDPLAIASNSTSLGGGPATPDAVVETKDPPDSPASENTSEEAAGAEEWATVISADTITAETKRIRLKWNESLERVVVFNAHYKTIRTDATVLASLAEIALTHSDDVSWKKHAPHVRDLATELAEKSQGPTRKFFDPAREVYEKLDQLLNGNTPGDLEEAEPKREFADFAKRRYLMRRFETGDAWLTSNISSEKDFIKEKKTVQLEASLMAALVRVIATEGYEFFDEEVYQASIKNMLEGNLAIVRAAEAEDFEAFQQALSQSQSACTACHQEYKD